MLTIAREETASSSRWFGFGDGRVPGGGARRETTERSQVCRGVGTCRGGGKCACNRTDRHSGRRWHPIQSSRITSSSFMVSERGFNYLSLRLGRFEEYCRGPFLLLKPNELCVAEVKIFINVWMKLTYSRQRVSSHLTRPKRKNKTKKHNYDGTSSIKLTGKLMGS